MGPYKHLLLDADNTLFDFNLAEKTAFFAVFSALGLSVNEDVYARYHEINDELWRMLERKEVTRARLKDMRFEMLLDEMGVDDAVLCKKISHMYFEQLSQQRCLLEGAIDVCKILSQQFPLYIITNGSYEAQLSRFHGSGLEPYFRDVFISEKIGSEKPARNFFDHVMHAIGDNDPAHYLVVGDSLTSDIDGSINAGIDCVFLDHKGNHDTRGRDVTYMIEDIRDLPSLMVRIMEK